MIRILFNSDRLVGVSLFSALVLLPSIVHLSWFAVSVMNPLLITGPLLAGFGLAARFTHTRLGFMSLGAAVSALIWTANWLMMAGGLCCKTIN